MSRNSEYTRWRRIAMQVVLCAVLGVTTLLAWRVEKSRASALLVSQGPPHSFVNPVLGVELTLPQGWRVKTQMGMNLSTIVAEEARSRLGVRRHLQILLYRLADAAAPATAEEAASIWMDGRAPIAPARPLPMLDAAGVLLEYGLSDMEDGGVPRQLLPVLSAGAVLPNLGVAVEVQLVGVYTFAPADFELLEATARSLKRIDPEHPAPPLQTSANTNESVISHQPGGENMPDDNRDNDSN